MNGVNVMTDSVYKVIELVGTSSKSWEEAARVAVERAAQTLRDLRIAEVVQQDLVITDGKVVARVRCANQTSPAVQNEVSENEPPALARRFPPAAG